MWLAKNGLKQTFNHRNSDHYQAFEFEALAISQALLEMPRGLGAEVWTDREKVLLWLE